jgi:hypothetical protein
MTTDRKLSQNVGRSTHCDIVCSGDHDFSDRNHAAASHRGADLDGVARAVAGTKHPHPAPRTDFTPPAQPPLNQPPLNQPNPSTEITWGAIGFTADGSYSTTWKMPSQPEAEARAAKGCAQLGRGRCEVVSFSGQQCGALATFIGPYRRRRWVLSFTAGGGTYPDSPKRGARSLQYR